MIMPSPRPQLTRSLQDRIFVGGLSLVGGCMLVYLFVLKFTSRLIEPEPYEDVIIKVHKMIVFEIGVALLILCIAGMVWSFLPVDTTERWLKRAGLKAFAAFMVLNAFVMILAAIITWRL